MWVQWAEGLGQTTQAGKLLEDCSGGCEVTHRSRELNNSSQFKPDASSTAVTSFPGRLDLWVSVPLPGLASGTLPFFSLCSSPLKETSSLICLLCAGPFCVDLFNLPRVLAFSPHPRSCRHSQQPHHRLTFSSFNNSSWIFIQIPGMTCLKCQSNFI